MTSGRFEPAVLTQQRPQGHRAEPDPTVTKEVPPGLKMIRLIVGAHRHSFRTFSRDPKRSAFPVWSSYSRVMNSSRFSSTRATAVHVARSIVAPSFDDSAPIDSAAAFGSFSNAAR